MPDPLDSGATETDSWWLGQDSERIIRLTGWIGEHPATGADVAHLLLYPDGHGAAAKMRRLAEALGLNRADAEMTKPAADLAHASLGDAPEGRSVWLHGHANYPFAHVPVNAEWESAATAQQLVVLTVGMDGGVIRDLGDVHRYLRRPHRLHTGLLQLL